MFRQLESHIDLHDLCEVASTWPANANSLRSALQYVGGHFAEVERKVIAAAAHGAEPKLAAAVDKFVDENGI
ncbi:hypothetical protein IQ16_03703 [Bradyrhizobium huanghuaihaiense]|uniref:Uncharacterized protein n=1 Tax=Bradyrhizobium huanghuaihaiense TaxID=990078 RepID=A0A562RQB7_9BRAD|nr:hypothetical protein [Bradyrhizobium huanghuaihaiense]TWI70530.1 hypothetical protein IQ16_03703 [Bradyrhizobium huanghuaihaiense]